MQHLPQRGPCADPQAVISQRNGVGRIQQRFEAPREFQVHGVGNGSGLALVKAGDHLPADDHAAFGHGGTPGHPDQRGLHPPAIELGGNEPGDIVAADRREHGGAGPERSCVDRCVPRPTGDPLPIGHGNGRNRCLPGNSMRGTDQPFVEQHIAQNQNPAPREPFDDRDEFIAQSHNCSNARSTTFSTSATGTSEALGCVPAAWTTVLGTESGGPHWPVEAGPKMTTEATPIGVSQVGGTGISGHQQECLSDQGSELRQVEAPGQYTVGRQSRLMGDLLGPHHITGSPRHHQIMTAQLRYQLREVPRRPAAFRI